MPANEPEATSHIQCSTEHFLACCNTSYCGITQKQKSRLCAVCGVSRYRHTHTHNTHTHMHAYIHTCNIRTYIHKYIHTYIHTYIPTCIQAKMKTFKHASMHKCMHEDMHIHAYIHTNPERVNCKVQLAARVAVFGAHPCGHHELQYLSCKPQESHKVSHPKGGHSYRC